jgi:hypothetical protein
MRHLLLIAILLFGVTGFAQDKTANVRTGKTYTDVSFTAADTINEDQTYYIEITNFQDYPAMQDVYFAGSAVTGSGDVVITVYGKKFNDDSYSSVGTSTWNSTLDLDEVITISTANRYRYFKVEFVSDATDKQVLLTDVQFKNWFTGGEFSTTALSLSGTLDVTGVSTLTGGYDLATVSTHLWTAGGSVALATAGTDAACTDGDRYWSEIMIPYNVTLTGLSYLVGSVGATDSVVMQLFNSAGVEVATTKTTGANHGTLVGTAAQFQSIDFASSYAAIAGVYYVAVQFNGITAKFRTYPIPGSTFVAGTVAGTWDTKADITPGITFTADKGPIILTH